MTNRTYLNEITLTKYKKLAMHYYIQFKGTKLANILFSTKNIIWLDALYGLVLSEVMALYTVYSTLHDYMLLFPSRKLTSFRTYRKP